MKCVFFKKKINIIKDIEILGERKKLFVLKIITFNPDIFSAIKSELNNNSSISDIKFI